ncbi:hypothetical protein HK101_011043 [Irineochytrium annulatum]|nr:hypothetical protein HK101_011043 [Irineochytrium annulatum]
MKRNFRLQGYYLKPDAVIFLGDLMDGGREWKDKRTFDTVRSNQTLQLVRFNIELARFRRIFPSEDGRPYYYIAGNHDIGFGRNVLPFAYNRFTKTFGPNNFNITIANHTILAIDTLSLSGYVPNATHFQIADEFLQNYLAYGVYTHEVKGISAVEHSIATFSWLQGNHFPGFAVLSLSPSHLGADGISIGKCAVPPQIRIYTWYIALLALTMIGAVGVSIRTVKASSKTYVEIPMFRPDRDADDEEKEIAEGLERPGFILRDWNMWRLVLGYIAECLAVICIVYPMLLVIDWW